MTPRTTQRAGEREARRLDVQTVRWYLDQRIDRDGWNGPRALDRLEAFIEQQQARIEELEGHIRGIITGADLHPGELPKGLVNALPILRTALNQNPPNPRSETDD